ncbi:MAG: rhodanese-like domain-containing protein [Saprospiraceae bacterium]|nr:rhodanese-like domain-containing protein [Saprospiraceae bacterium]
MKLQHFIVGLIMVTLSYGCQPRPVSVEDNSEAVVTPSKTEKIKPSIQVLNSQQFAQKINATEKAQVVDVRTVPEFEAGHLDQAININVNGADFATQVKKNIDPNQPIFVYCQVGGRSARAAKILADLGYTQIYDLAGGYQAWSTSPKYQVPDPKTISDH